VFISTCSGSKVENVLLISEDCAITAKKGFAICGTIKEPIPNPKCRICNGPVAFSFHKFRINFCPAVKDGTTGVVSLLYENNFYNINNLQNT
jgi:hypothetical protein